MASLRSAADAGRLTIVASAQGRAELEHVLATIRFRPPAPDPGRVLARFDQCVEPAATAAHCGLTCRDPADQKFLDLAVAVRADRLLTRDKALLRLARRARTRFALTIAVPAAADRYE